MSIRKFLTLNSLLPVLVIWGLCPAVSAVTVTKMPAGIAKDMRRLGFNSRGLSVFVQAVDARKPLLAVQDAVSRNPASVMKLVTTAAALDRLGPAYRWKTEVYSLGDIQDGTLLGNLYIKGYGDPYMVPEFFWKFLRDVLNTGVHDIQGDLVLDESYFDPKPEDPGGFDSRPLRSYNVSPKALLVNFQSMQFRFRPDRSNNTVHVTAFPHPTTVHIDNRLSLTRGRCGYWKNKIHIKVIPQGTGAIVRFSGRYAQSCAERGMYRVVTDAPSYLEGMFRKLWVEQGGRFKGNVRTGRVPADATLLHSGESQSLTELIRGINKFSNNVMTRQLLLTLGADVKSPPGTRAKGIAVIRQWLVENRIKGPLIMDNGAGLSRTSRISARQLGQILLLAYHKPYMAEFMSSLPINAVDGTMSHRLQASNLAGRMHIKTGSLDNVRSIAGYVMSRSGRRFVVVMLHNHRRANTYRGEQLQDALLQWVFKH